MSSSQSFIDFNNTRYTSQEEDTNNDDILILQGEVADLQLDVALIESKFEESSCLN